MSDPWPWITWKHVAAMAIVGATMVGCGLSNMGFQVKLRDPAERQDARPAPPAA